MPKKKRITKFDRSEVRRLREELIPKLQELGLQLGLTVTMGAIKFQTDSVKCPLTFSLGAEAASALGDTLKADFERDCAKVGLKPEHFGKPFDIPGEASQFKVVGVLPNRPKNNTRIERLSTGKEFICPAEQVLRYLGETSDGPAPGYEVIE